ncbi:MAG: thioredoxin family protein [Bacteroidota bacterium]
MKNTILTLLMMTSLIAFNSKSIQSQVPGYKIGEAVDDFNLKNIDGNIVSLASLNTNGAIVIFTCNHCPYAKAYESRIIDLDRKYKSLGYPVVAINPNSVGQNGEDSPDENKIMANDKGFNFPYLKDEKQEVTNAFGAKRTPTAYVLKKENGKFILKYAGAIDDNSQSAESATKKYVELAIGELLIGKSVTITNSKSIGCGIKFKNV